MRSVLVTGASKGIGAAIAVRLARDGFEITVHYRSDDEGARKTADEIERAGGRARVLAFDVADRAAARSALEADIAAHGPYYGVVSNAGIHRDNVFPALSGDDWDAVLRTDLDGFYNVLHPCVMPMIQAHRGGRIVVLSSVSGVLGNRGQVNYSAAKAGLIGAAKALALELAKREITVNCVAPGLIETSMVAGSELDSIVKAIPARRIGRPEEVAALVAYLFSDLAAYVTRQVIRIDGGLS
ncbi:MAG TPA: 3-ketoacyl-ACP reductase FabG2 [Gammaproteobacteria bacterium]|nr:3-ketoacyl-ACP reductase FabG2 [Gammaproteobacteria bacterium]